MLKIIRDPLPLEGKSQEYTNGFYNGLLNAMGDFNLKSDVFYFGRKATFRVVYNFYIFEIIFKVHNSEFKFRVSASTVAESEDPVRKFEECVNRCLDNLYAPRDYNVTVGEFERGEGGKEGEESKSE